MCDVIKLPDYISSLFTNQGILVFLLKILFDKTIVLEDSIQELNTRLDAVRHILPAGALPTIKIDSRARTTSQDELPEDLFQENYTRKNLLDIILKVELAE